MGVETSLWRARIGRYVQPRRTRYRCKTLYVSGRVLLLSVKVFLFLALLTCGDIESNPGPPKNQNTNRQTRQTSLHFSQPERRLSHENDSRTPYTPQNTRNSESHDEMFDFLRNMKQELAGQNERVVRDLASVNSKIDSLTDSINDLKTENELLKQSNKELKSEITTLTDKIDTLEAHSRRNNLRFNGIAGTADEEWGDTEQKIRDFIDKELNMPEKKEVEIDRAHRLRSGGNSDRKTIIVKFTKYKDCMSIFQKASETLGRNSAFSVQQDFTDRVKRHRRELGKEMIEARQRGQYASIRYDKLLLDNKVYKYDDTAQAMVCVGNRNRRPRVITNSTNGGSSRLDAEATGGGASSSVINNDDPDSSSDDNHTNG